MGKKIIVKYVTLIDACQALKCKNHKVMSVNSCSDFWMYDHNKKIFKQFMKFSCGSSGPDNYKSSGEMYNFIMDEFRTLPVWKLDEVQILRDIKRLEKEGKILIAEEL